MRMTATTLAPETTDAERKSLHEALRQARLTGPHLEIGTAAGGTLKELIAVYPAATRPPFVVVDPLTYFPNQRNLVERNLSAAGIDPATIDFRVSTSSEALRHALARKESFSFIFIDAIHTADQVTLDLTWTRLLDVGGLVALHDYCSYHPGVIWAVRRFLGRHRNYKKVSHADSLIILKKTAPSPFPEIAFSDRIFSSVAAVPFHWRRSLEKRFGATK